MELYQMKYENIADRLKRLATSPQPNTLRLTTTTHPSLRPSFPNPFKKDTPNTTTTDSDSRNRYIDTFRYSKLNIQTDNVPDQQILPTRTNPRDYLSPTIKERKREGREGEGREEEGSVAKVKSESTLKIEEIMESFNSYKQNKEKFMSSLGKYSHNRTETEPAISKYAKPDQPQPQQAQEGHSRLLGEIDNIWSERRDGVPQFQRSGKAKCQLDELTDILNETIECQQNMDRPKDYSRPKSTLIKNIKTEEAFPQDRPLLRTILSPRGARAPGRICKNTTGI